MADTTQEAARAVVKTKTGLVIAINEQEIVIYPSELMEGSEKTIHFKLDNSVRLGTPAEFAKYIADTFEAPQIADFSQLPSGLSTIAKKIGQLVISLKSFDLYIPPSKRGKEEIPAAKQLPTGFTLQATAYWDDNDRPSLFNGKFAIRGICIEVVRCPENGTINDYLRLDQNTKLAEYQTGGASPQSSPQAKSGQKND